MYAGNMSESFGHEYVQMFVRTKWSFLKSFISRNAMSITHFPAMPLALSATSSSYFVDRDLPLARSLFSLPVSVEQKWDQIRISEMKHRTE